MQVSVNADFPSARNKKRSACYQALRFFNCLTMVADFARMAGKIKSDRLQ
jgi:hypothetical protein